MTALTTIQLFDRATGTMLLQDTGRNTGLEVAGAVKEIMV